MFGTSPKFLIFLDQYNLQIFNKKWFYFYNTLKVKLFRYYEDGSKKLNACCSYISLMVYF